LVRCSVILITLNDKGTIRMTLSLVMCSVILIILNDKGTIRMSLSLVRCSNRTSYKGLGHT
jgi:hypothetical protein